MNENLITFLYELANFVVFAVLLGWIFVKPIRKLLDEKAAQDAKLAQTAQQHLAEAAQLRQELIDDRQKLNKELEQQRQTMLAETRQEADDLLKKANQSISLQREHLTRETLQLQQQQLTDLARVLASSSMEAVQSLLTQINGPSLKNAFIESACQQLSQAPPTAEEKMTVNSADELDGTAREKIATAAGIDEPNGRIEYRVDPDLRGGLRIKSSRGVIDNSIVALSAFAEQNLRHQLNQCD